MRPRSPVAGAGLRLSSEKGADRAAMRTAGRRRHARGMSRIMGNVLALAFLALPVAAPATPAAAAAPAGCAPATPAAVAGFFDGALPGALAANRVPGAVVSVVSGG